MDIFQIIETGYLCVYIICFFAYLKQPAMRAVSTILIAFTLIAQFTYTLSEQVEYAYFWGKFHISAINFGCLFFILLLVSINPVRYWHRLMPWIMLVLLLLMMWPMIYLADDYLGADVIPYAAFRVGMSLLDFSLVLLVSSLMWWTLYKRVAERTGLESRPVDN